MEHPWNRVDIIPLLRIILDDLIVKWNQKKPNEIRSKITFGKVTENDIHIIKTIHNPGNKKLHSIMLDGDYIQRYRRILDSYVTCTKKCQKDLNQICKPLLESLLKMDPPIR